MNYIPIYHYTNANGLFGILNNMNKNIKLWFSKSDCLNDSSEGSDLQRIYSEVCDDLYNNEEISKDDYTMIKSFDFKSNDNSFGLVDYEIVDEFGPIEKVVSADVYICSFSNDSNSIDMWRYYSKGDIGYSIGFDISEIEDCLDELKEKKLLTYELKEVIYDKNKKKEIVKKAIINNLKQCKLYGENKEFNYGIGITVDLYYYQFCFKHECFSSEKEIRCIITMPNEVKEHKGKTTPVLKYRNGECGIIPYIEIEFSKTSFESIMISPTAPEASVKSTQLYINDFVGETNKIIVKKSDLPVRY